jgi:hypothetical protein
VILSVGTAIKDGGLGDSGSTPPTPPPVKHATSLIKLSHCSAAVSRRFTAGFPCLWRIVFGYGTPYSAPEAAFCPGGSMAASGSTDGAARPLRLFAGRHRIRRQYPNLKPGKTPGSQPSITLGPPWGPACPGAMLSTGLASVSRSAGWLAISYWLPPWR